MFKGKISNKADAPADQALFCSPEKTRTPKVPFTFRTVAKSPAR